MRKAIITNKNKKIFLNAGNHVVSILTAVDELLQDKGLELIVGDDRNSEYHLKINRTLVDEEYDNGNTQRILHSHGHYTEYEKKAFILGQNMPSETPYSIIQNIIELLVEEARSKGDTASFKKLAKAFAKKF